MWRLQASASKAMRSPCWLARSARWCSWSAAWASSSAALGATLAQTSRVPAPSAVMTANLHSARRRLAASWSGRVVSKSRNGW